MASGTLRNVPDLVLVRHGQSDWNAENLFTGWVDRSLTDKGRAEAEKAGRLLAEISDLDLRVVHTSVQTRAVQTANLLLDELGRSYLPVRRNWRLNERHYGALQGLNKKETAEKYGADQVKLWRRSYSVRPPQMDFDDPGHPRFDPRYSDVPATALPSGRMPRGRRCSHDPLLGRPDRSGPRERWVRGRAGRRPRQLHKGAAQVHRGDLGATRITGLEIPTGSRSVSGWLTTCRSSPTRRSATPTRSRLRPRKSGARPADSGRLIGPAEFGPASQEPAGPVPRRERHGPAGLAARFRERLCPRSPVRTLTTVSTGRTQILPSPIFPVLAAFAIASTTSRPGHRLRGPRPSASARSRSRTRRPCRPRCAHADARIPVTRKASCPARRGVSVPPSRRRA